MQPESTALNLSERIDALAAELRNAGVPPERSARLLASAASAAIHAVTIDSLLSEPRPGSPVAQAAAEQRLMQLAA